MTEVEGAICNAALESAWCGQSFRVRSSENWQVRCAKLIQLRFHIPLSPSHHDVPMMPHFFTNQKFILP